MVPDVSEGATTGAGSGVSNGATCAAASDGARIPGRVATPRSDLDAVPGYPFPRLPIAPAAPFSWAQTVTALRSLGSVPDRGAPAEQAPEGDAEQQPPGPAWELPLRLAPSERLVVVRLEPVRGSADPTTSLRVSLTEGGRQVTAEEGLTLGETESVWRGLDDFLALGLDLAPLLEQTDVDPAFQPVERALHGFHPPRFRTGFQAACWTVVRQRTPQSFAVGTMERLTALLGDAAEGANGELRLFPTPARITVGARAELLAATNNVRKVERLEGVAERFAEVDEEELRLLPLKELLRWLESLPGLGPWSAEQVAWRGFGRVEEVAWRDTGAIRAISDVYAPGLKLTKGSARQLASFYGDLKGVWLSYLKAYPRVIAGAQG